MRVTLFSAGLPALLLPVHALYAQEAGFVNCHDKLLTGKVVHDALKARVGCSTCYSTCHLGIIHQICSS